MDQLKELIADAGIVVTSWRALRESDAGTVWIFNSPGGDQAIDVWRKLREIVGVMGHWPVILGDLKDVEMVKENFEMGATSVRATLDYAATIDGEKVLADLRQERIEDLRECDPDEDEADFFGEEGEWPEEFLANDSFTIPFDISTRKPIKTVAIALTPTPRPWEVPAFLGIGGWNECPEAAKHVAMMKRWNDHYEAEIVGASRDVIEMTVGKPPTDQNSALELAREQYVYCGDIVDQGTETIANLAAGLLNGSTWFFWWD